MMAKKIVSKISSSIVLLSILLIFSFQGRAQNDGVYIGNTINLPHQNAALEIASNNKGLLIPRWDSNMRVNFVPTQAGATGLLVFDTDYKCFYYFIENPNRWVSLCEQGGSGTTPSYCDCPGLRFEWFNDTLCIGVDTLGAPMDCMPLAGAPGVDGISGIDGLDGHGLLFEWHGDTICVQVDTLGAIPECYPLGMGYQAVGTDTLAIWSHATHDTLFIVAPQGPVGPQGEDGYGLVFEWHNDSLCVSVDTLNALWICYPVGFQYAAIGIDTLAIWTHGNDTI
ncbi:MAG: hypothetical protein PHI36_02495, partial [Bacteroidales bacterium]|nr:hypothetical protein [Bacteroidales bacterium]